MPLLTDSLSALQALSGLTDTNTKCPHDNLNILALNSNLVLESVGSSNVGILGNEVEDRHAKEGNCQSKPNPPVSYREAKMLIERSFRADLKSKNGGFRPDPDHIHSLNRREQTVLFRLKTGYSDLNKHMKSTGLLDTASCQYSVQEQTSHHILQSCIHLEDLCQKHPIHCKL